MQLFLISIPPLWSQNDFPFTLSPFWWCNIQILNALYFHQISKFNSIQKHFRKTSGLKTIRCLVWVRFQPLPCDLKDLLIKLNCEVCCKTTRSQKELCSIFQVTWLATRIQFWTSEEASWISEQIATNCSFSWLGSWISWSCANNFSSASSSATLNSSVKLSVPFLS